MIRILADDLTGALDAAGPFARPDVPVSVHWNAQRAACDDGARVVLDTATRELDAGAATARTREGARSLWSGRAGIAFKKVDSVWRGSPAAEIAAACAEVAFDRVVVAPAFPQQGRVTRDGAQWVAEDDGWRAVVADIAAELRRHGLDAAREAHATRATRAFVCDAQAPEDLAAIVARHRSAGVRTLWCGTRGLASALARGDATPGAGNAKPRSVPIHGEGPVLVVVGTDHPVSVGQARLLESRSDVVSRTIDAATGEATGAAPEPRPGSVVLLRFRIAEATPRQVVRQWIARALAAEVRRLPRPAVAVVTGGETLRSLCDALGATRLEVVAEREPGIPIAQWSDGRWAGATILSKSGGFGAADLFVRVVEDATRRHVLEDPFDDPSRSHRG